MKINMKVLGVLSMMMAVSVVSAADLALNRFFSDNMVLQREKPVNIWGAGTKGETVTVTFSGQTKSATVDKDGTWVVSLDPMKSSDKPQALTVASGKAKPVTVKNVVIGDVWFFGRQSYIDVTLGSTKKGEAAAAAYKPTGVLRTIGIQTVPAKTELNELDETATTGWTAVDSKSALGMSAAAFYLGADLEKELGVPVGIVDVNMSYYFGMGWMSEKAIADSVIMHPKDKEITWLSDHLKEHAADRDSGKADKALEEHYQAMLAKARGKQVNKPSLGLHPLRNPSYPSAGYNAVISPLRNLVMKGILLQLGNDYPFIAYREIEKAGKSTAKVELDAAWGDNYMILKNGYRVTPVTLPYVPGDWRRTFADEKLPIGLILPPGSDLDVYAAHNREIRELHRRTAEKQGLGLIIPGMDNVPSSGQPVDEVLLAERCRNWVLGAVENKKGVTASGPVFETLDASLGKATIYFKEGTAEGLKAVGDILKHFETAGPDRVFTTAKASIDGTTIKLESDGPIQFVRFNWSDSPDPGLVNAAELPALPFNTDADWTFGWIPPPEQPNLPEEYGTTADKWSKSNVAIINGQIANMATGDSERIPLRPGPIGMISSPFGPNIYVMGVEPESPASGRLMIGDVIYGVNGRIFDDGPDVENDAQYHVLAAAITHSESNDGQGKLVFSLRRGVELMDVELKLQVMGSYSSTTPYYCEKSEAIVKNAEAWASKRYRPESGMSSEPTGMLNTDLLFLLASGNPEHLGLVRRAVYKMISSWNPQPVIPGMTSKPWSTGHNSMLLGEYFHATGDRNVLPYLKYQADLSSQSQLKPANETPAGKEAAADEQALGGWRHNYPGNPERWKSGYGLLPHAGMSCVMGMQLAKEAGLQIDDLALQRGLTHFRKGRAEHAFILYSYFNVRRKAPKPLDPKAEDEGKLDSMNGKLGMAAALFDMVEDRQPADICARSCAYAFNNTRGGHGGMFFNNFWTPVGAWSSGEKGFKHFMKNQTWWRELFRRHDGSFNQAGRGKIGISYAIPYVAPKQLLRMLGAPKSAFGTHCPEYLKPALAAHSNRDYAACENFITTYMNDNIVPAGDLPVVNHFLESVRRLRASIDHDLTLVENALKNDKYYYASLEIFQLKRVVSAENPRLKAIVATLESAEGAPKVVAHRKACEAEEQAQKAAFAKANPKPKKENWVDFVPAKSWQMKVFEHVSHAPSDWMKPSFDDANWNAAKLPISWMMYHTALFRSTFTVEDPATFDGLRVNGKFFQQANVLVYLNGELVAKIDEIGRGTGNTLAPLTDYGRSLLKPGKNTIAISSRHKRRWGPYRGTYKTAATMGFTFEGRKVDTK